MKFLALFREPLVHFLLIGAALFLLYGSVAGQSADSRHIEVSREQMEQMSRQFQSHWNRAPTSQELTALLESHIRDEVLYREGVAMGLEADDPVIKRRIRQKLEVMSEESNQQVAPTDAELGAYLFANPAKFRQPAVMSFEQVHISGDAPVPAVEKQAAAALAALRAGTPAAEVGQASMLPTKLDGASLDLVTRDFGAGFARQLEVLTLNAWEGPIASSFGAHLVRVTERTPAAVPALGDARPLVLREWENDRRERNRADAYRAMAKNYRIAIDGKPAAGVAEP